MLTLETFKVESDDEALLVRWALGPTSEDINDYVFSLKRIGAPFSDFDKEGDLLLDEEAGVYRFRDTGISLSTKYLNVWYLLRLKNTDTGATADFGPVTMDYEAGDYGKLIQERNNILLENYNGVPVKVLKARRWGNRCPSCWDEVKQRTSRSRCLDCYNTGFYKGYYEGIDAYANFSPPPELVKLTRFGELEIQQSTVLFSNNPRLVARDLVVETTVDRRWRVADIDKTEFRRARIHQLVKLVELDPGEDIEFKIPV